MVEIVGKINLNFQIVMQVLSKR